MLRCSTGLQDRAEEKVRVLEARAEEQRKAKELEGAEWRRQQHERELARQKVTYLLFPLQAVATSRSCRPPSTRADTLPTPCLCLGGSTARKRGARVQPAAAAR